MKRESLTALRRQECNLFEAGPRHSAAARAGDLDRHLFTAARITIDASDQST